MVLSCICLVSLVLFSAIYVCLCCNNSVHVWSSKFTSLATRMATSRQFLGTIEEFKPHTGNSVKSYLERVAIFFDVNDIPDEKKSSLFLTLAGEATYSLLRSLCAPALPSSKGYDDLQTLLTNHLEPEPLVISERFHFHRRAQREDESVAEFGAELRRLAARCSFQEAVLDETIRDRFVCGLRSEPTQRRLLTEKKLTLQTAVNIALSMESADKTAKTLKGMEPAAINVVRVPPVNLQQNVSCYRCGKKITRQNIAGSGESAATTAEKSDTLQPSVALLTHVGFGVKRPNRGLVVNNNHLVEFVKFANSRTAAILIVRNSAIRFLCWEIDQRTRTKSTCQ